MTKSKVIVVEKDLITAPAYLSLKGISPQLLMLFYCRRKFARVGRKGKQRWICTNKDEINFTYLEAQKRFGIQQARFTRGLDSLINNGFIDVVHSGGCYKRDKSVYMLSERWRKFDHPEFKVVERPKDAVSRGYRKPKRELKVFPTLESDADKSIKNDVSARIYCNF